MYAFDLPIIADHTDNTADISDEDEDPYCSKPYAKQGKCLINYEDDCVKNPKRKFLNLLFT